MKITYVLSENARGDVIEAALWEEARYTGLGEKLLRCIDEAIDQICKSPMVMPADIAIPEKRK